MSMTIDEAIAHARDVAKRRMAEYENHYDKDAHYYPMQCKKCAEEHEQLAKWLEELKQYREIGTVEECRESVGKQTAKKPRNERSFVPLSRTSVRFVDWYKCGKCNSDLSEQFVCCPYCLSVIDWSDVHLD